MEPITMYTLADVLAVAKIHPFYSDAKYLPEDEDVCAARKKASSHTSRAKYPGRILIKSLANFLALGDREEQGQVDLKAHRFVHKKDLYKIIERLVNDTSPENTYRNNVYTSVTGGGSTLSVPLFFATDALENRRQRAYFGEFLKKVGFVDRGDWVLSTHHGGNLYRSLDLMMEIMENAGASVLAAGNHSAPSQVVLWLQNFSVNVIMGDGSQIVALVHYISTLKEGREKIKLNKVIYTSDGLSVAQRAHILNVLGPVKICSVLGSAEAGPYGANTPDLTPAEPGATYSDFIFDTRMTLIEILPLDYDKTSSDATPETLPGGETGVIAQTVLARLRNPVVRYITGDVGSLHPLSKEARSRVPQEDLPYFRILRLQGRDRRFSFSWDGSDTNFDTLATILSEGGYGVLQWQVVLSKMEPSLEVLLEVRVLCKDDVGSRDALVARLRRFFEIEPASERKFKVAFVEGISGFELSKTGHKVIKFVDRSA